MKSEKKTAALILAAGKGIRFGEEKPKQFAKIAGKTILEHTIDKFEEHPLIDDIYLVTNPTYYDITLGIVKKNAILQVDYTNTLVANGKPVREAVIEADHARLRPILMTTLTIIAGMLPLALGKGDGSGARSTMATLIIGGQTLCLAITLLLVPVLYTLNYDLKLLIDGWKNRIREVLKRKKG